MEAWKRHPKYTDYLVSDQGRVRGPSGKTRKPQMTGDRRNYHSLIIYHQKRPLNIRVHKLVLETFVGPRPKGMVCCHGPKGTSDNSVGNLCWGTPSKNSGSDKRRDGTSQHGEKNCNAKVTEDQAKRIIKRRQAGETYREIAEDYGISLQQVHHISSGKQWKHLTCKD